MTHQPRILVLSASVGAGHLRAAQAVELALREVVPEATVRNVDVLELTNTAFSTARWLDAQPTLAQAFTDALVEGIRFAKSSREPTERALAKYLELDDREAVAEAYDHFVVQHLTRLPDPGLDAARAYLESLVPTDPRAASARPADFFDLRFVDQVKASGLVERLYGN